MVDYAAYSFLDVAVRDGIAIVTLNDPERGNAWDAQGHYELSRIMREIVNDPEVRAVVTTGAGDSFSVGPRPERVAQVAYGDAAVARQSLAEVREIVYSAIDCEIPVACALNGPARGSALTFALLADVIIIEEQVSLSDTHVLAGLTAGDGGVLTLPVTMGLVQAKRYLLTGDPISAEEAFRLGLVTEIVGTGQSLARATDYAQRWASGHQTALRTTKRSLNQWLRHGALTAFDVSLALEQMTLMTPEVHENMRRLTAEGEFGKAGRPPGS